MRNCTAHLPLALHHQGILRASSSEGSILCLSEDARNNGDDDEDDGGSGGGGGVGDGGSGNVNDCDQDELSTTVKSKTTLSAMAADQWTRRPWSGWGGVQLPQC